MDASGLDPQTPAPSCPAVEAIADRMQALCDDQRDPEIEDAYRLHRRFDRIGRLVGDTAMAKLLNSSVMVIGLGGVGSFAAESLARSGVGHLTLVDFDRVCITNSNRQLQAMKGAVGKFKADVLAERLALINPQLKVEAKRVFYNHETADELLAAAPDFVVDAIDNVTAKCHLINRCKQTGQRLVSSTGASGRMDPTQLHIADLSESRIDPLAHAVRKILRQQYGFGDGPWGIPSVFSTELPMEPVDLHYDGGHGFRCVCPGGKNTFHSCEERNVIWGTAGFVTGTFGLSCASVVVRAITGVG